MQTPVVTLFEQELARRDISFSKDKESGRYELEAGGTKLLVSLDNLQKDYAANSNPNRIPEFVDFVLSSVTGTVLDWNSARAQVIFSVEPSDHVEPSPLRIKVSDSVDLVPALLDQHNGRLIWIEPYMLNEWGVTSTEIETVAQENLANALQESSVIVDEHEDGNLAYFTTDLPFKAPLLFAPNLKTKIEKDIGWPVHAVLPNRDFVFLWSASTPDTLQQISDIVCEEFENAPYPLTLEVLKFGDSGCKAIRRIARMD